jgi:hypothetical protein
MDVSLAICPHYNTITWDIFGWSKKTMQVMMVWSGNGTITMDDDVKTTREKERLIRKKKWQ